jgi:plasmid stabilization system protein ParE
VTGFVLHPAADSDLEEIWEYVAEDNIDAADRLLSDFYDAIRNLTSFPRAGHTRPDLSSRPIRFQLVREYLIAYVPDSDPLVLPSCMVGGAHVLWPRC